MSHYNDTNYVPYAEVKIPEPQPVGYMPGGTIPVFDIGYIKSGSTIDYTVQYVISKADYTGPYSDSFYFVASVPLPSSAPLFGAGLIALGAAGYAAKRGRTAAA